MIFFLGAAQATIHDFGKIRLIDIKDRDGVRFFVVTGESSMS
jgi:hypothetical protein